MKVEGNTGPHTTGGFNRFAGTVPPCTGGSSISATCRFGAAIGWDAAEAAIAFEVGGGNVGASDFGVPLAFGLFMPTASRRLQQTDSPLNLTRAEKLQMNNLETAPEDLNSKHLFSSA